MAKKISDKELKTLLESGSSAKRQKGIKYIGKNRLSEYGRTLFTCLKSMVKQSTGASKSEYYEIYYICIALGDLNYKDAILFLREYAKTGAGISGIGATISYLRLSRNNLTDFRGIFNCIEEYEHLRQKGLYTGFLLGALTTISLDKMVPDLESQAQFVAIAWSCLEDEDSNAVGLFASCCAGFEKKITKELLYKIAEMGMMEKSFYQQFALDALVGKYNRYEPWIR